MLFHGVILQLLCAPQATLNAFSECNLIPYECIVMFYVCMLYEYMLLFASGDGPEFCFSWIFWT